MKKLNLMFDEKMFFAKCNIIESPEKLRGLCHDTLQDCVDNYEKLNKEGLIVSVVKDLNKCRAFMRYLLEINKISEKEQSQVMEQLNITHARRENEGLGVGIAIEIDDKLAKTLIEDIIVFNKLLDMIGKPVSVEKVKKLQDAYKFAKDVERVKAVIREKSK